MSECERQTELLTKCIRTDETGQIHRQVQKVAEIENEERCLRRAVGLMAALAGFAIVAAGQSLIVLDGLAPYHANLILRVFGVLGVASLICLPVFAGLWIGCRGRLTEARAQYSSLVQGHLAARTH